MELDAPDCEQGQPTHSWLRKLNVAFVPGPGAPWLKSVAEALLTHFNRLGHTVQASPDSSTDVIFTTAPFGEPLNWRKALLFTARRRFELEHSPTIYTLVGVTPGDFQEQLSYFRQILGQEPPDPNDYDFPGMAPESYKVLFEQGRRGGPILALERVVQSQAKCIDVLLVIGDGAPETAYLFNLVGAYPHIKMDPQVPEDFYTDVVLRIVTALSTDEVTEHQVVGDPIPHHVWKQLSTPAAMCKAGRQFGKRRFFTEMVRIAHLVKVPAVADAVSSQYSEGCFSTWDPELDGLIATVTGSARPVDKGDITEDDLTVIVGMRPDGKGAQVRHVEGKRNDPPSTEAVEMIDMDNALPTITLGEAWRTAAEVPVVRSKLHGHRGVAAYDPDQVEYVPMAPSYHHYPVTCATEAQAQGIKEAFSRAEALRHPEDPRQVVFTVLPGHGTVIVEKWVPDTRPFQMIWEAMDNGALEIDHRVPQGPMDYVPGPDGRRIVKTK